MVAVQVLQAIDSFLVDLWGQMTFIRLVVRGHVVFVATLD